MSDRSTITAHDARWLEDAIRLQRRAREDEAALAELAGMLRRVTFSGADLRRQALARTELERRRSIGAPALAIRAAELQADPVGFAVAILTRGEDPRTIPVTFLSLKETLEVDGTYRALRWIADAPSRVVRWQGDDWPHVEGEDGDPTVASMFEGTRELVVDGKRIDIFDQPSHRTRVVHGPSDIAGVRRFFGALVTAPPPALDEYRTWYRALHVERFLSDDASVPEDGALAWDYAIFLAAAHRLATRLERFYAQASRKGRLVAIEA